MADIGRVFSATINGVEHTAADLESLVGHSISELASIGIAATGSIPWLVRYLIEQHEDPVRVIHLLSARISVLGGDVAGTLEEVAAGVLTHGLYQFAKLKVDEAVRPLSTLLQESTARGQAAASVHHTTLHVMQAKLDLLKTGDASGVAWRGPSVEAMSASYTDSADLIGRLTIPLDGDGPQARLNQICEQVLVDIIVVGTIVVVLEIIATAVVAVAGAAAGGAPALVVLGAGGEAISATLELIAVLIGADLLAWLLGSLAIWATTQVQSGGPKPATISESHAQDLPLNPGNVVPGGRVYIPPKSGRGQPVRSPHGGGYEDASGNRWEWARDQHGGPHWDVQHKDGSHTNVAPDGKVIGPDNFPNDDSLKK